MKFCGRIRPWSLILPALCILSTAHAETIHLKNGRTILADSVREVNGRVEYTIGENTFALPKSSVVSIDTGGSPVVTHSEDIPAVASQPELTIHDAEEISSRLVANGKLDIDYLSELDRSGDADKATAGYWLAAQFEETHGSYETAAKYLQRADVFTPNEAIILTHYGSILLRLGKYKESESVADRATRLAPDTAAAFAVLGYAQLQLSKTKAAIIALKRSLELRPDSTVEDVLKKAQRELAAEGDFSEESSSHFALRYEGGKAPAELRRQILQTLERHFDDLSRDLNFLPREIIPVVLYNDKQYFDVTQAPSWAGALYDGKLRMPISGLSAITPEVSRALKHELTHSFISAITKGRCPTWLNEGVAQLEEPRSARAQGSRLASLYVSQHNIPLNELEGAFTKFSSDEAQIAYAQSLIAIEYIRDTYGMSALADILKRLGEGQSVESALRSTIHSGYGQFETELTAYLKRNYGG